MKAGRFQGAAPGVNAPKAGMIRRAARIAAVVTLVVWALTVLYLAVMLLSLVLSVVI